MSEEQPESTVEAPPVPTPADLDPNKPLGPKGESALAAEKQRRKDEAERRRAAEEQVRALQSQLADKQAPEQTPDVDAIRAAAQQEAAAQFSERILRAELMAAAGGKLTDPADAPRFIDLSSFEADADGNFNSADISEAIGDLLQSKPYLSAQGGKKHGSADGGARNGGRPDQLTREHLKSMTPDAVEQARIAGRFNDVLGIK